MEIYPSKLFIYIFQNFEAESINNLYKSPIPEQGGVNSLAVGMTNERGQAFDTLVVDGVRDNLFPENPHVAGFDLLAINIHRARDHGIPGTFIP